MYRKTQPNIKNSPQTFKYLLNPTIGYGTNPPIDALYCWLTTLKSYRAKIEATLIQIYWHYYII